MEATKLFFGLLLTCAVFCINTSFSNMETYSPIFMKRADLENSIRFVPEGRELMRPGKIYLKSPYIYINERYKGVHIYDNTNPEHPVNKGFITIPGCIDIAIKGNILYADNAIDLVAIDLDSHLVTHRIMSVFPEPAHPNNSFYWHKDKPEDLVLVEWKLVTE